MASDNGFPIEKQGTINEFSASIRVNSKYSLNGDVKGHIYRVKAEIVDPETGVSGVGVRKISQSRIDGELSPRAVYNEFVAPINPLGTKIESIGDLIHLSVEDALIELEENISRKIDVESHVDVAFDDKLNEGTNQADRSEEVPSKEEVVENL